MMVRFLVYAKKEIDEGRGWMFGLASLIGGISYALFVVAFHYAQSWQEQRLRELIKRDHQMVGQMWVDQLEHKINLSEYIFKTNAVPRAKPTTLLKGANYLINNQQGISLVGVLTAEGELGNLPENSKFDDVQRRQILDKVTKLSANDEYFVELTLNDTPYLLFILNDQVSHNRYFILINPKKLAEQIDVSWIHYVEIKSNQSVSYSSAQSRLGFNEDLAIEGSFHLLNEDFRVTVIPSQEFVERFTNPIFNYSLLVSFFFGVMIGVLSYVAIAFVFARIKINFQQEQMNNAAKMAALGTLAGGIAHEIKTPLTVIYASAEQLISDISGNKYSPDRALKKLMMIRSTTEKINSIVRGMKSFSRDGSQDPFELTSINNVVAESIAISSDRAHRYHIEIQNRLSSDPDYILRCRPTQIQQVLINLINNSIDSLAEQESDYKWIRFDVEEGLDSYFLRVTDSGPSLSLEVREKIMTPFFTTKIAGKGTGLGLSISRNIMDSHKGQLTYDETSPTVCFVLEFPKNSLGLNKKESA